MCFKKSGLCSVHTKEFMVKLYETFVKYNNNCFNLRRSRQGEPRLNTIAQPDESISDLTWGKFFVEVTTSRTKFIEQSVTSKILPHFFR